MNVSALVKRIAIRLAEASLAGGRKQSSNGKTCHECPAGRSSRNSTTLLSSTDCFHPRGGRGCRPYPAAGHITWNALTSFR